MRRLRDLRVMLLWLLVACWGGLAVRSSKPVAAQAQAKKMSSEPRKVQARHPSPQITEQELAAGTKAYLANCGRCHNPPQDLTPREACAVVRQMRVRAMLSARDARLILLLWRHDPPSQMPDGAHDKPGHAGAFPADHAGSSNPGANRQQSLPTPPNPDQ